MVSDRTETPHTPALSAPAARQKVQNLTDQTRFSTAHLNFSGVVLDHWMIMSYGKMFQYLSDDAC